MDIKEIEDYLNKETRVKNADGSETITIRAEPWLNWFIQFCENNTAWCEAHLTENNFEDIYKIFGCGWSQGFEYASHLHWKRN